MFSLSWNLTFLSSPISKLALSLFSRGEKLGHEGVGCVPPPILYVVYSKSKQHVYRPLPSVASLGVIVPCFYCDLVLDNNARC